MKRVASGYYTEEVSTTLDGKPVSGLAEVCKVEGQNEWYIRLECDGMMFIDGGDWYPSKKSAIEALRACCEEGFTYVKGLGVCVKS